MENSVKILLSAALALLAVAAPIATAQAADDQVAKIRAAGVLKACHAESLPWAVKDAASGEWKGSDILASESLAKALGVKIEHVDSSWSTLIPNLEAGKCDIVMAPVFRTSERALRVLFSDPSGHVTQSIGVKADSGLKTYADLDQEGKTVAVISGTGDEAFALRFFKKAKVQPLVTDKVAQVMIEVASGRADAFLTDTSTTNVGLKENPNMNLVVLEPTNPLNPQGYSYAMRKGEYDFVAFVNVWQSIVAANGDKADWDAKFAE
jgi:polar amino acid transport system substrate-binding protein